jgi:CPA2 family monovalent cation:H+ antiporter-2
MVLLSTLAISKHFEGTEMLSSIFKLVEFLLFWFLTGIFLIPTFLKKAKKYLNDETLLVVSLGLCFGMVILATEAGFSSALGAFVMGSILAETIEAERIEHLVQPVKNLFGAVFFVSVGMMIDLSILSQYILPIMIISSVVIIGQVTFGSLGVLLSGQPLKVAIQSGFSLSQIGEFSYIIAALGLSLGVIASHLYPIIVAVSVITIFISPYIVKLSEPAYKFVEKKAPGSWQKFMNKDSSAARPVNSENTWKKFLKELALMAVIYLAFTIMAVLLSFKYLVPLILKYIGGIEGKILSAVIIVALISPFLRAIMAKKNRSKEFEELWSKKINRGPLIFLIAIRIIICMIILSAILLKLFHITWLIVLPIVALLVSLFFYSRQLKKQSILLERRFKRNFHARQVHQEQHAPVKSKFVNRLLDRDLHLADFEIKQEYSIVGKTLKELNFRQMCGVNVVKIIRGRKRINIPGGEERIYPLDRLVVLGNDTQMIIFQQFIEEKGKKFQQTELEESNVMPLEVNIEQFQIEPDSKLIGKTIKTSHIRDKFDCLVVGVERGESSTMNPDVDLEFEPYDIVWVIGEHDKIIKLNEL